MKHRHHILWLAMSLMLITACRLQAQEEVNGDTRIDVPQGIYVVVLESGSDAKRMKVIVK